MGTSCRDSEPINATPAFTSSGDCYGYNPFNPHLSPRRKFNTQAKGHDRVNVYLLMMASRLIFADQLGVNWTDQWQF